MEHDGAPKRGPGRSFPSNLFGATRFATSIVSGDFNFILLRIANKKMTLILQGTINFAQSMRRLDEILGGRVFILIIAEVCIKPEFVALLCSSSSYHARRL
jgi:hypothetical protein